MIGTSLQRLQLVVYAFALIISTSATGGRLWARRMTGKTWQANDYLMVVAYLFVLAMVSMAISMVDRGELGVHGTDLAPERHASVVRYVSKANYILSILMQVATSMVKLSMTEFYLHIFPQGWLHHACHIQLVALTLFLIAQIVSNLTICRPITAAFGPGNPGTCGDVVTYWLSISIIALFFDITCVALPMPIFWTLSLSPMKKFRLTVLFGLGFVICGLTGARVWVYRVLDYTDPTWGYAHGTMLTIIEPSLGILAGCLPIMSPCLLFFTRRLKTSLTLSKSTATMKNVTPVVEGSRKSNPFQRLEDHMFPLTDVKVSHGHSTSGDSTDALTEEIAGLRGIQVKREVLVDSKSDDGIDVHTKKVKKQKK